jgi:hypothetical protein
MLWLEQQVAGSSQEQEAQVVLTCWAGSRVSTNTHMGVSYVWYSHREGLGTFAMLPRVREEKMRTKERSEGVTWIVLCWYSVVYLNMRVHSAYMLVGPSTKDSKSCLHCTSHTHAFLAARGCCWSRGVTEHLNTLSTRNRGSGCVLKHDKVCCTSVSCLVAKGSVMIPPAAMIQMHFRFLLSFPFVYPLTPFIGLLLLSYLLCSLRLCTPLFPFFLLVPGGCPPVLCVTHP